MKCVCFPSTLVLSFWLFSFGIQAQVQEFRFAVFFKDKGGDASAFSLEQPEAFLSPRALNRRETQAIALSEEDFPVHLPYRNQVLGLSEDLKEVACSRWMNFQMVVAPDSNIAAQIQQLPFVQEVRCVYLGAMLFEPGPPAQFKQVQPTVSDSMTVLLNATNETFYGNADRQNRMLGLDFVHALGGWGQNLLIAVMDGGFKNYNKITSFQPMLSQERVIGTWDFVAGHAQVAEDASHGMQVLSCMASWAPGQMVGSAPAAHYVLFRTEHTAAETPMEPFLWICAAEVADSLGADVLNTSLGYTTFDAPFSSYAYEDLNGELILVSKAASLAARKGMLVFNSAGNSGGSSWKYIGAPADAKDIVAVGAVDSEREKAGFSSFGPAADGRVKPELAAMGRKTALYGSGDALTESNGTSFSSPVLAGAAAAFWSLDQNLPWTKAREVMLQSGHLFSNPGPELGFGIPHFGLAYALLNQSGLKEVDAVVLAPNPVPKDGNLRIFFHASDTGEATLSLLAIQGSEVLNARFDIHEKGPTAFILPLQQQGVASGVYSLQIHFKGSVREIRVVVD